MGNEGLSHIGAVADIVGLSLRTIRYYEEVGLVTPSARTPGGFRLYNSDDIDRLKLIKRMKPLGYPLEEIARLLNLVDALDGAKPTGPDGKEIDEHEALQQLNDYSEAVQVRIMDLSTQISYAQEFRDRIIGEIERRRARLESEAPADGTPGGLTPRAAPAG